MRIPKILRPFLTTTAEGKTPTDEELDNDIEYVSFVMHEAWPLLMRIIRNKTLRMFRYRWKFLLGRCIIIKLIMLLSYFAFIKVFNVEIVHVGSQPVKERVLSYPSDSNMNLRNFLLQIAYGESRYVKHAGGDSSQYWGLYQIGADARRYTGYGDVTQRVFMRHPEIQDLCMVELLKYNRKYLAPYIKKYSGRIVDGILVTESGILALAQLGCGAVQHYLDSGVVPAFDENGNQPRQLLKLGGYMLDLDKVRYSIQDAVNGPATIR